MVNYDEFGETWPRNLLKKITRFGPQEHELKSRWLWKFTHHTAFGFFCGALIILNAFLLGYEAQDGLQSELQGKNRSTTWATTNHLFTVWFCFELLLRIVAEQRLFLGGKDLRTNLLDVLIVGIDVTGSIFGTSGASKASVARVLRLFRFIRIFRIIRVMKAFQSLRLLAFSIIDSIGALLWCAVIVFMVIYLFAVLFIDGATDYFDRVQQLDAGSTDPAVSAALRDNYGSVMKAMVCLFMTISGGIDWHDAIVPLRSIHWVYEPVFIFYAFIMLFGVLNVVIATFVENTAQISRKDKEAMVHNEMNRVREYAENIKHFFHDADTDRSGMLSWEEFERHLEDNRVKAYFQALELDVSEARVLFELLDQDESDAVEIDEFIGGCMKLKGAARSLDVNVALRKLDRLALRFHDFLVCTGLEDESDEEPEGMAFSKRLRRPSVCDPAALEKVLPSLRLAGGGGRADGDSHFGA